MKKRNQCFMIVSRSSNLERRWSCHPTINVTLMLRRPAFFEEETSLIATGERRGFPSEVSLVVQEKFTYSVAILEMPYSSPDGQQSFVDEVKYRQSATLLQPNHHHHLTLSQTSS